MSYEFEDVLKPEVAGAGASTPKDPNVHVVRTKDVLTWPTRNAKGVLAVGDLVMKPGKKVISVYMTGVNQKPNFATEGDVDKEQIMQKFEATHPGDELEAHEFYQNNLGEDLVIFYGNCADNSKRMYGTPCAPLRMKGDFMDDKDGRGFNFNFEQIQGTRFVPAHYNGNLPVSAPYNTDVSIDMLAANGKQYKVEALAVTDDITLSDFDLVHGDVVTLIGSGGAGPATLSAGDLTEATVILVDGQQWTALENATISFDVVDGGSTIYLVEKNRS